MTPHHIPRYQAGSAAVTVLSILLLGSALGVLLLLLFGNRNNGANTVSTVVPGIAGTSLTQNTPAHAKPGTDAIAAGAGAASVARPGGSAVTGATGTNAPKEGEAATGSPGQQANTQEKTLEQTVVATEFKGTGAQMYTQACQSCHMSGGKGAQGAGTYPALAGNPKLNSAPYVESMVLFGHGGMPGFGHYMNDNQVSTIVNYVRTELNKNTDKVNAEGIKKLRPVDPHYMIFGEAAG